MNHTAKSSHDMLSVSGRKQKSAANSLPDYVRRLRHERNLSLSVVSARSGGKIGKTHINRIENGLVTDVSLPKLRALAKGLDVPEDELVAVAQGKFPSAESRADEARLLHSFRQLSPDRRQDILKMLRALADDVLDRTI